MSIKTVTVTFAVNSDALNQHLGNTPNVTAVAAVTEFLNDATSVINSYCDRCGSGQTEHITTGVALILVRES